MIVLEIKFDDRAVMFIYTICHIQVVIAMYMYFNIE